MTHVHQFNLDADLVERIFFKPFWCPLSEKRLVDKLANFQPFGVKKHLELLNLVHMMHYVCEDEEDTEFDDYISKEDHRVFLERSRQLRDDVMVFNPTYKFRPTAEEILDKVTDYFDLDLMDKNDLASKRLKENEETFELPAHIEALYDQFEEENMMTG